MQKKGYPVAYTYDEWSKIHPTLDVGKVWYLPGVNAAAAYYDGLTYLNIPYLGTNNMNPNPDEGIEETDARILKIEKEQHEKLQNREYIAVVLPAPDGIRPALLKNILAAHGPSPEFYKAAMALYNACECDKSVYDDELMAALAQMKPEE